MTRPVPTLFRALLLSLALLALAPCQAQAGAAHKVELYVTKWCPYCKKAAAYFQDKGIPFASYDIESDPAAAQRFKRYGARGVPLVLIDDQPIAGYSVEEYDKALGQ